MNKLFKFCPLAITLIAPLSILLFKPSLTFAFIVDVIMLLSFFLLLWCKENYKILVDVKVKNPSMQKRLLYEIEDLFKHYFRLFVVVFFSTLIMLLLNIGLRNDNPYVEKLNEISTYLGTLILLYSMLIFLIGSLKYYVWKMRLQKLIDEELKN